MRCSKCAAENPTGKKFCGDCGAPLANLCPKCGSESPAGKRFCGECGASLAPTAAGQRSRDDAAAAGPIRVTEPAPESIEGERKSITALFADIKGSTEFEQNIDPEEAQTIVDPALKMMIDSVHRYDGYVVQTTGDGIFALFGAPIAHEDHAQRALYAGLQMQEEMRRYSNRLVAAGGNPLQIRVGANTGEVVVRSIATDGGHIDYTPIGHTANLASRMQTVAPIGSIAIAEPTRKLCEGYFTLKPMGPTLVKGVSEPVNVYEVTGLGPLRTRLQRSAGRGLTKFVGREREMASLANAAELTRTGHGQIVAAVAEAGTGKSRLFYEFKVKNQSEWMVLEAFSVSHGKASAYLPLLDLLHTYFDIESEDDARKRREKVTGRLLALDWSLEDALPYMFALLGIVEGEDPLAQTDPQVKKRRTLDAVKRILLRESLHQPLIVMFEDLHWIDEGTQEFLNLLADSTANARLLLLVNYRPEYSHAWGSKTYYTQLRLDPLGKETADEMLTSLLGGDAALAPLKRVIIERTEGNPFFMEETVQVLLDDGALVREGPSVKLTRPLGELKIPPTVQGILASRIDRLPADTKDLLQTLAVIGKEFPISLIRAVVATPADELDRMLNDLQLGEFIYEQPAVGNTEYTFKHALTQEVAYNSVLGERRRQLHERIGLAIESLYADTLDDHLSTLAHHFSRSADSDRAVTFLAAAGRQLLARYAYAEAQKQLHEGLQHLAKLPESSQRDTRELALVAPLADAMWVSLGLQAPETVEILQRAAILAEKTGNLVELIKLSNLRRVQLLLKGEFADAASLANRVMELAEREGSPASLVDAYHGMLQTRFYEGDLAGTEEQFANWRKYQDARASGAISATARTIVIANAAICAWMMGRISLARDRIAEATTFAAASKDPFALMIAKWLEALVRHNLREPQGVMAAASQSIALSEQNGFANVSSIMSLKAWAIAHLGDSAQALALARNELEEHTTRAVGSLANTLMVQAEVQAIAGMHDAALDSIQKALSREKQGSFKPDLFRIRGDIWLQIGKREAAEADFREAIACSKKMDAKMLELRAATSLARLLRDTDRRDEAHTMLSEIYNWFTEGFDTADLKDAKALLDEMKV